MFSQSGGVGKALVLQRTVTLNDVLTVELLDAGKGNPFLNAISVTKHADAPAVVTPPKADLSALVALHQAATEKLDGVEQAVAAAKKALADLGAAIEDAS